MLEPAKVTVNGRGYLVTMFDPLTAFDFFLELENAKSNGRSYNHLARRAIGQCRTPDMGKDLADAEVFSTHFAKHPEDMLPLMREAMDALCAPFVKKPGATSATARN